MLQFPREYVILWLGCVDIAQDSTADHISMETFGFCLPKCDFICASCGDSVWIWHIHKTTTEARNHASLGQGLKLWLSCIWWASCNQLLVSCKCCYCSQLLLSLLVYIANRNDHKMDTKVTSGHLNYKFWSILLLVLSYTFTCSLS